MSYSDVLIGKTTQEAEEFGKGVHASLDKFYTGGICVNQYTLDFCCFECKALIMTYEEYLEAGVGHVWDEGDHLNPDLHCSHFLGAAWGSLDVEAKNSNKFIISKLIHKESAIAMGFMESKFRIGDSVSISSPGTKVGSAIGVITGVSYKKEMSEHELAYEVKINSDQPYYAGYNFFWLAPNLTALNKEKKNKFLKGDYNTDDNRD